MSGLQWHPSGKFLALTVGFREVRMVRVDDGPSGPKLTQVGDGVRLGGLLSAGSFTPDGRHFVITDTGWAPNQVSFLVNGRGTVSVLAIGPDGAPSLADAVRVPQSPEGFAISPSGTRLAVVSMRRTYLPARSVVGRWAGTDRATLNLIALDPNTGRLSMLDQHDFEGLLPEDAEFDETGRHVAVAIYHYREDGPRDGYVELWSAAGDRLARTGHRIRVPRGPHDLIRLKARVEPEPEPDTPAEAPLPGEGGG